MNNQAQMQANREKWIADQQAKLSAKPDDTKACKSCSMSIPKAAKICPYCRKRLRTSPFSMFALLFFGIIVFVFVIGPFWGGDKKNEPSSSAPVKSAPSVLSEHDEAQEHAKNFILKTLKAPDSAKFPPYSEIKAVKVNGIWEAETYVDAQNSFGAMIRTPYFLKMENQGALWRLSYIGQEPERAYVAPQEHKPVATSKPVYRSVDKDGNPVFSDNPQ